jgi:hypothetical protein
MKALLPLLISIFILAGCVKKIDQPSWIEISEWEFLPNASLLSEEGELSHNFSNAWVYANGKLVGVFELPVKLPLLLEGKTRFQILPTVLNNGISATKKAYPFVQPYDITVDLVKGEKIKINPFTKHYDEVKFWIEDFEESSLKFENDGTGSSDLVQASDPSIVKYGSKYGLIALNTTDSQYNGYTNDSQDIWFQLPKGGAEVYLEIDYRSTNSLVTGLIEVSNSQIKYHPNIQLNAQDPDGEVVWKKIYIDLKEIISNTSQAEYYKISLNTTLNSGGIPRDVIIDNVKVLHF